MTGENGTPKVVYRPPALPVASAQPGGRAPAPGQLSLVQSFINSHFGLEENRGAELWSSPTSLRGWLRAHGLIRFGTEIGRPELDRALGLREALRLLAAGDPAAPEHTRTAYDNALSELNRTCPGAGVELRFDERGPSFVLGREGTFRDGLGLILGITAGAMKDGHWSRLKICPGLHCGWAFYDTSRNQTGRWCSMAVCGGRAKARTHYRRRTRSAP